MRTVVKVLVAIATIGVAGYMFVRSAQSTRAEPFEMATVHLDGWTLGLDAPNDASGSAISLRPPAGLPPNLFQQLFRRQMESLSTPADPGIALALRSEIGSGLTGTALMGMAKQAGLAGARPTPRCVGYRRVSATGATRQLYFVWFDLPEHDRFRKLLEPRAASPYRPEALSPVMLMAAEPGFFGWHPVSVDEAADCIAPVNVR